MKTNFFITVNRTGSVKITKGKPSVSWDEIAVAMQIELPDLLFKRPHICASIIVPESEANPLEITAEMSSNIQEAIASVTGMQVRLQVGEPDGI